MGRYFRDFGGKVPRDKIADLRRRPVNCAVGFYDEAVENMQGKFPLYAE